MKKIIVEFRENDFNLEMAKVRKTAKAVQEIANSFKAINGVNLSLELLDDLCHGAECERAAGAITEATKQDLQNAHIKSQSVIDAAIKGDIENLYSFKNSINRNIETEYFQYLEIENNTVTVRANAAEELKEQFTTSIQTEKGLLIYERQKQAIEALNSFLEVLPCNANAMGDYLNLGFNFSKKIELPIMNYDRLAAM